MMCAVGNLHAVLERTRKSVFTEVACTLLRFAHLKFCRVHFEALYNQAEPNIWLS